VVSAHSGLLDGAVHAFDLSVCPRVIGFGKPVINVEAGGGEFEGMSAEAFAVGDGLFNVGGGAAHVARRGEVSSVVCEDGVNFVRHQAHEGAKEVGGILALGSFHEACEGELGGSINGHEEIELALCGSHLGQVDVEVADGVGFELFAGWTGRVKPWQATDAVTLEAAMKSGAGQLWDGGLEGVKAIIEREQRVLAKGHSHGLLFDGERGGSRFWPHGHVLHERALAPLSDGLWVDVVALREL